MALGANQLAVLISAVPGDPAPKARQWAGRVGILTLDDGRRRVVAARLASCSEVIVNFGWHLDSSPCRPYLLRDFKEVIDGEQDGGHTLMASMSSPYVYIYERVHHASPLLRTMNRNGQVYHYKYKTRNCHQSLVVGAKCSTTTE